MTLIQYTQRRPFSGKCSDRACPCGETSLPAGRGYLYISPEAVQFMKMAMVEDRPGGAASYA